MLVVLALLFQSAPAPQSELVTAGGVHEVSFRTLHGTVRTYLPDDAGPGEPVSGAVQLEPAGRTEAERQQNLGVLSGYVIESGDQRVPARDRLARWRVTAGFQLRLVDARGRETARVSVPPLNGSAPRTDTFEFPGSAQAGSPLTVHGPFTGDMAATRLRIGGEDQQLLAESPRKVVARPTGRAFGPTRIEVEKGERRGAAGVRYVGVQLEATKTALLRGETATLTVTVFGLKGIAQPTPLHLANLSQAVITMSGGDLQQVLIAPDQAGPDGTFRMQRQLTGVMAGSFNIRAVVQLSPTANIHLPLTVDRTLDSWTSNTGIAITPGARSLIQRQVQESRPTLDRVLAQQAAFDVDEKTLLETSVRQYCFELRDRKRPRSQAHHRTPAMAMGFIQASAPSLGGADVRGFSFMDFLSRMLLPLSARPVGHLEIRSDPADAEIVLNREMRGYTNKVFVVSVGEHDLQVKAGSRRLDCGRRVVVAAGRKQTVLCKK